MPYPKNRNIHRPPHIYFDKQIYFLTGRTLKKTPFFRLLNNKEIFVEILNNCLDRFEADIYAWVLLDDHYHLLIGFSNRFRFTQSVTPNVMKRNDEMSEANFVKQDNKFRRKAAQFVIPKTNLRNDGNDEMNACLPARQEVNFVKQDNKFRPDKIGTQFVTPKYQLVEFIRKLHKDSARIINQLDHVSGRKIWYQYWDHCIRNEVDFYKHFNYIHQNLIKHGIIRNLNELENYNFSSYKDWIKKKGKDWALDCFEKYPIKDFVEKSENR